MRLLLFVFMFHSYILFSQTAIGGLFPDFHAQLDVISTEKGILVPRVTLIDVKEPNPLDDASNAIPESLLIYNTGNNVKVIAGYYYWFNSQWNKIATQGEVNIAALKPWNVAGGTISATSNDQNIYQKGNVGIGESEMIPKAMLDVRGDALINSLTIGLGGGSLYGSTAVGTDALMNNIEGYYNTALGVSALRNNIGGGVYPEMLGQRNTALGAFALASNTDGSFNLADGYFSLYKNIIGSSNVAVGFASSSNNISGSNNIGIGREANGWNVSGNNNIAIGSHYLSQINPITAYDFENSITIGNGAIPIDSNTVRLGNNDITGVYTSGNYYSNGDDRHKENVQNIPLGLDFINKVRPVEYIRINSEIKKKEWGVIAQELQRTIEEEAYENASIVEKDNNKDEYLYISYNQIIAPMIKAIQELSEEVQKLSKKVQDLNKD